MAQLVGLHNPAGTFPAFLVPIFREHERANALSVQAISGDGLVEEFDHTIVTTDDMIRATQFSPVDIGDPALWSFAFAENDFEVNRRPAISRWLKSRLDELVEIPFLYLEAAEFVGGSRDLRNRALHSVFMLLSHSSEQQAEAWRNFDVVLPEVRAGIRSLVAAQGREDEFGPALRRITVRVRGNRLIIVADNDLVELISQSRGTSRRALARVSSIVSAFGLLRPSLQPREPLGKRMTRAESSGRRLTAGEAAMVKAMLARGDRHHDIAAWFGVNQGRIADVKAGNLHPEVANAAPDELPPQGSPGPIARTAIQALDDAAAALNSQEVERARQIVNAAREQIFKG